jgi:hypothetical protein
MLVQIQSGETQSATLVKISGGHVCFLFTKPIVSFSRNFVYNVKTNEIG